MLTVCSSQHPNTPPQEPLRPSPCLCPDLLDPRSVGRTAQQGSRLLRPNPLPSASVFANGNILFPKAGADGYRPPKGAPPTSQDQNPASLHPHLHPYQRLTHTNPSLAPSPRPRIPLSRSSVPQRTHTSQSAVEDQTHLFKVLLHPALAQHAYWEPQQVLAGEGEGKQV
ncbi:hypothetical protein D9615_010224 [Tricholomella constricta]|uniref:Uncharacterized protein n=1 Tax=Tricholomella constricta TaxID=117010 RepID=A0A8H5GQX1_9AGAR|nr:hypothetical protein D9615_010224 [Tricholomella constricta]